MTAIDPPPAPRRRTRTRSRPDGVTIEQVARRANVSVATVSRALRGLPNVAPSTRSRVEQVARELSYQVDTYASRLATGRSDTVGLAVPNINTWYFGQVAAGVEAVVADAGMDVLLHSVDDGAGRARLLSSQSSVRRRLDGLILIDILLTPAEIRTLAAEQVDVVTVGQRTDEFPSVTVDNRHAALTATRHLIELGHERIGLIGGSASTPLPFDVPGHRRQGYVEALLDAGLGYHPDLEADGGFSVKGGSEAMVHLMTEARRPTAVFALSDEMAMGALKTAGDLGLRVPEDVSIVGFDDHELAAVFGLTTIRQDPEWHGATAGRSLLALDELGGEVAHVVGETRLIVRRTTSSPGGH
jgi:LacI family repressor for deo operon, udp, cdd, tsx, nupC, and nupG